MITKKWLGFAFMAVVLFVGFTSCSSDDDLGSDEEITASLVGTWEVVKEEGWYDVDGEREPFNDPYEAGEWVFEVNKDGTGKDIYNENSEDEFTWTVKDKALTLRYEDGYFEKYDILKLTSSQLVIEQYNEDEDGEKEYFKLTLKKK